MKQVKNFICLTRHKGLASKLNDWVFWLKCSNKSQLMNTVIVSYCYFLSNYYLQLTWNIMKSKWIAVTDARLAKCTCEETTNSVFAVVRFPSRFCVRHSHIDMASRVFFPSGVRNKMFMKAQGCLRREV